MTRLILCRTCVVGLALLAGCRDDDADAVSTVKRFFAAAEAGDCVELGKIMIPFKGGFGDAECKGLLDDFKEKQLRLVSLGEPKVDGRDKNARMIPASMHFKGGPHSWQMRAEKHDGTWKVRF